MFLAPAYDILGLPGRRPRLMHLEDGLGVVLVRGGQLPAQALVLKDVGEAAGEDALGHLRQALMEAVKAGRVTCARRPSAQNWR